MNPSASGWVKKFGHIIEKQESLVLHDMALFLKLKQSGFIYGASISIPAFIVPEYKASFDEKTKINFLYGLYGVSLKQDPYINFDDFLDQVIQYYKALDLVKKSFFDSFMGTATKEEIAEKIIEQRVFPQTSLLNKTLGNVTVNTYLYLDLLCFKRFLEEPDQYKSQIKKLETLALGITQETLLTFPESKKKLEQLIKSSLSIENIGGFAIESLPIHLSVEEKRYFLILACLNSLHYLSTTEVYRTFIKGICVRISFDLASAEKEVIDLMDFIKTYKKEIPALKSLNIGEQLYDNLSLLVNKLILRNSKRLLKELKGSQELVVLLTKSTHSDLSEIEKKKIQEQLLDIFKSIPSLAIFILPGGAILLPIFIKLIPKLLPSAFDDNRIS